MLNAMHVNTFSCLTLQIYPRKPSLLTKKNTHAHCGALTEGPLAGSGFQSGFPQAAGAEDAGKTVG